MTATQYTGGPVLGIVMDPTDWQKAYAIDATHVWAINLAVSDKWIDVTGNFTNPNGFHSIAFVSSGSTGAVLVGGPAGVFSSQTGNLGTWEPLGLSLPHAAGLLHAVRHRGRSVGGRHAGPRGLRTIQRPAQIFGVPALVSVSSNITTYTDLTSTAEMTVAPDELTFTFNPDQVIDPSTLSGIEIVEAGPDGTFYDPVANPNDIDDIVIHPGYIGIGSQPNQVVVRFSQTLPADTFEVVFVGQGSDGVHLYYGPDGKVVKPLENTSGLPLNYASQTAADGTTYMDGSNVIWTFDLTQEAPQVVSVVPQPITRNASTAHSPRPATRSRCTSARPWTRSSVHQFNYYQLIATQDTASTTDDVVIYPTAAVYNVGQ